MVRYQRVLAGVLLFIALCDSLINRIRINSKSGSYFDSRLLNPGMLRLFTSTERKYSEKNIQSGNNIKPQRYIHPQVIKMFRRAQQLIKNGDNLTARKLLKRCVELNPFDSHSWLALARLEAKIGNFQKAREVFIHSNQKCPKNVHLLHAWGHLEQKHGNIEVARQCWSEAFTLDPLNAYVCHAFSSLEVRLRNYENAENILREVVQKKPTAALCVALADLERHLGSADKARETLKRGLERCEGEKSKLLLALAWLEEDIYGKTEKALELINEAEKIDPGNVRVYTAKANLLLRKKSVKQARAALKLATSLHSAEDGQHYTMWGTLELDAGDFKEARRILKEGAQRFPGDQFLLQRWGTLEAKLGNRTKARELFEKSVLIQPHAPTFVAWAIMEETEGIEALAKLNTMSKKTKTLITPLVNDLDLSNLDDLKSTDPEWEQWLNTSYPASNTESDIEKELELIDFEEKENTFFSNLDITKQEHNSPVSPLTNNKEQMTDKDESKSPLSKKQQLEQFAQEKFRAARQLCLLGMEADPQHGPLYHAFGNIELRRGNLTEARKVFQRGIAAHCQGSISLYHALGLLEIRDPKGDKNLARKLFRQGIEFGMKGSREVDNEVGFLLHSLGMLELSERRFEHSYRVFSTGVTRFPQHSQMLLGLALVCMRLGRHSEARGHFRAAVDADTTHLHAWQSWAIAEKQLGNLELARILFRQGLKHGPLHGALWQGYAVMEMQQGNVDVARALFSQALKRAPTHAQSYQAWACLEARLGNLPQAKMLAWEGLKRASGHAALWTVAGLVEDKIGDSERANKIFEMGIKRFPNHGALYKARGETEFRKGYFGKARECFALGMKKDPFYAAGYLSAALLEAKLGKLEEIQKILDKAEQFFQLKNLNVIGKNDSYLEDPLDLEVEKENVVDEIRHILVLATECVEEGRDFVTYKSENEGLNSANSARIFEVVRAFNSGNFFTM